MSFKSAWLNDGRITNISPLPVFDLYSSAYYPLLAAFVVFTGNQSNGLIFLLGPVGWLVALSGVLRDGMLASFCAGMFLGGYWNAQLRNVHFSYSLWSIFYEALPFFLDMADVYSPRCILLTPIYTAKTRIRGGLRCFGFCTVCSFAILATFKRTTFLLSISMEAKAFAYSHAQLIMKCALITGLMTKF
jgi:hypothetical protein